MTTDTWLARPKRPTEGKLRLFCFPYAGGGAAIYRDWVKELPEAIEVWPAKLPGRESRFGDEALTDIGPLIDGLAPAMLPLLDRPFALFGHSLGAAVGLELAHRLGAKHGKEPVHLFVSGRMAPNREDRLPPVTALDDAGFTEEIQRRYGSGSGLFDHPELVEMMLPTIRADCRLNEVYARQPEPELSCPITAFRGAGDTAVTEEDMEAWRAYTSGPFACHVMDGDHFFVGTARPEILQTIAGALAEQVS